MIVCMSVGRVHARKFNSRPFFSTHSPIINNIRAGAVEHNHKQNDAAISRTAKGRREEFFILPVLKFPFRFYGQALQAVAFLFRRDSLQFHQPIMICKLLFIGTSKASFDFWTVVGCFVWKLCVSLKCLFLVPVVWLFWLICLFYFNSRVYMYFLLPNVFLI